jgi:hypothetical protein
MDGFATFSFFDFFDLQLARHLSLFSPFSQQFVAECPAIPQLWHIPLNFPFSPLAPLG